MINIAGVWGWRGKNEDGGNTALADWEDIATKGNVIVLAFDSDILTKPEVRQAVSRFKRFLEGRGTERVRVLVLPPSLSGKTGVDDYIFETGATAEDGCGLRLVKRLSPTPSSTLPYWQRKQRNYLLSFLYPK